MSLKCCCSRPVCSARVFSFLCVCSRLLWVSAGLPTDARGRPTGGGGGCGSSRHAPAFGQQLQFGLLHAQCRFGIAAFFGLPRSEEHTSELQSLRHLVCRLLLEKKSRREFVMRWSCGRSEEHTSELQFAPH